MDSEIIIVRIKRSDFIFIILNQLTKTLFKLMRI